MPVHSIGKAKERKFFCPVRPKAQGRVLQNPAKLPLSSYVSCQPTALGPLSVDPDVPFRRTSHCIT